jgi:hypothetical protein
MSAVLPVYDWYERVKMKRGGYCKRPFTDEENIQMTTFEGLMMKNG